MDALWLLLIAGLGYVVSYHVYGRFLSRRIFGLRTEAVAPSHKLRDGVDYVPTRRGIVFGHHFTSIAGTGPIIGPAIGIIWGWLPALLWVTLGCIFMGAVHDFGALVVSMRNEGRSISEAADKYINARVRFIFFAIVFLTLLLVIAVFGVVIAEVFARFPNSVAAVWLQIPIAVTLGWVIYKKGGSVTVSTMVAVAAMYATIWLGSRAPFAMPEIAGMPPTGSWTLALLIYAWIASTLPVTTLLQPRDYINAWQLFIMMSLLALGVVWSSLSSGLPMVAPLVDLSPQGAPPLWPFLFITIACGAVSGFHSLVASGTSPKQVEREPDAQFVGYGSMLLEGALAVLVLICVGAGIAIAYTTADGQLLTGFDAWNRHYSSWSTASGMGANLTAVVVGAANMMGRFSVPETVGIALMGVFIASFAGTTLDTATRIQRYVIGELANDLKIPFAANRWVATTVAVVTAAALAFATGADGKGALILWPLFGSANQLLASLALLVVTLYLRRQGGYKYVVAGIPCLIMLTVTNWAMIQNELLYIGRRQWLLAGIGGGIFILAMWMTVEAVIAFFAGRETLDLEQVPAATP